MCACAPSAIRVGGDDATRIFLAYFTMVFPLFSLVFSSPSFYFGAGVSCFAAGRWKRIIASELPLPGVLAQHKQFLVARGGLARLGLIRGSLSL